MTAMNNPFRKPFLSFRSLNWALLCMAVCSVFLLGRGYGTRYYTAWGDETLFVEIAETFATRGVFGAPSFEGNGLKMNERTYFMPPLYPVLLSAWFFVVHSTLGNARVFSNMAGALCILAVFGIARRLRPTGIVPGLLAMAMAVDVQFAFMFNWARPDMLACALSVVSVWIYFSKAADDAMHLSVLRLTMAYTMAVAGMMTHPIGGAIGFLAIPLHILIARPRELRRGVVWGILVGIPLAALCLWGLYVVQDVDTFRHQFFDWQTARKSGRLSGVGSYVALLFATILNFGVKGDGLAGSLSTLLICVLGIEALGERNRERPALLVLLLVCLSGLAVNYGGEMAYPPLRLPAFYLALAACMDKPCKIRRFARIRQGVLRLRYAPLIGIVMLLVMGKSTLATIRLLKEVRHSERSASYSPSTLAREIIAAIPKGSSVAIQCFPDCFDILSHSRHFSMVNRLLWTRLSSHGFREYVCRNDFLVLTDSVLEPRLPGYKIDFTEHKWGTSDYRNMASQFFTLEKTVVLPEGGVTRIYKRDPGKVPVDDPDVRRISE